MSTWELMKVRLNALFRRKRAALQRATEVQYPELHHRYHDPELPGQKPPEPVLKEKPGAQPEPGTVHRKDGAAPIKQC